MILACYFFQHVVKRCSGCEANLILVAYSGVVPGTAAVCHCHRC